MSRVTIIFKGVTRDQARPLRIGVGMTEEIDNRNINQVTKRLSELQGVPIEKIRPSTRLKEDLGINGDDVDDFLSFLVDLGVDLSKFDFYHYFSEEPHLFWIFRKKNWGPKITLTGADIVRVIQARTWIEPLKI